MVEVSCDEQVVPCDAHQYVHVAAGCQCTHSSVLLRALEDHPRAFFDEFAFFDELVSHAHDVDYRKSMKESLRRRLFALTKESLRRRLFALMYCMNESWLGAQATTCLPCLPPCIGMHVYTKLMQCLLAWRTFASSVIKPIMPACAT
jgi:hypothetical protein